ncbi:hypothetical protein ACFL27_21040, partial [candidate division CSSED10-310 bacterium]
EQARGQVHRIDRRTDVYGLGATLYSTLVGKPPYDSLATYELFNKIITAEPISFKDREVNVPFDLECIVMKCLSKESQRRYESARALADDLQRYLEGEPVQARKKEWLYRAAKKTRKHKMLLSIITATLMVIFLLIGMTAKQKLESREKARIAQQFGQQVKEIEWIMKSAYMLPLHDVSLDKTQIYKRLQFIRNNLHHKSDVRAGAGHCALGRIYLLLNELDKASFHLHQALDFEYRGTDLYYALGSVYSIQYQKALQEVKRIKNTELRELKEQHIVRILRKPALMYLKKCRAPLAETPLFIQALIDYHEEHYDQAITKTKKAFENTPWNYNAKKLEGDAYLNMAQQKYLLGQYKQALFYNDRAGTAYQEAMNIGRSDTSIYSADCDRLVDRMLLGLQMNDHQVLDLAFKTIGDISGQALIATPDNWHIFNLQAQANIYYGELLYTQGKPFDTLMQKALTLAQKAIGFNQNNHQSYQIRGYVYWLRSRQTIFSGEDVMGMLIKMIDNFERAVAIDHYAIGAYNSLGIGYRLLAEYNVKHGLEIGDLLQKSIHSFQKGLEIGPNLASLHNNLARTYMTLGSIEINSEKWWNEAVTSSLKAVDINPHHHFLYNSLGNAYYGKGDLFLNSGRNPVPYFQKALENYRRALDIAPSYAFAANNLGEVYYLLATFDYLKQSDPSTNLAKAFESFQKSDEISIPQYSNPHKNKAKVLLLKAEYLMDHNRDPSQTLLQARKEMKKALALRQSDFTYYITLGDLELKTARWQILKNNSPEPYYRKARQAYEKVNQINPQSSLGYQKLAEHSLKSATWCLENNENCLSQIESGITNTKKALSLSPDCAETVLLLSRLQILEAPLRTDPEERCNTLGLAAETLNKSERLNAHLKKQCDSLRQQMKELEAHLNCLHN